jgi:hypothetical protein
MRVVNRQQFFTTLTHYALRSEEIFRGRFVSYERICGDVAGSIARSRPTVPGSTDQATAFVRSGFASVRDNFIKLRSTHLEVHNRTLN